MTPHSHYDMTKLDEAACRQAFPPPSVTYKGLFDEVQRRSVFRDQKDFADAIPVKSPGEVLAAYHEQKDTPDFDLVSFVHAHFKPPLRKRAEYNHRPDKTMGEKIRGLWSVLEREPDEIEEHSSLLHLPYPYVVPGGRFSEIYYWDSFFTMLGLDHDDRHEQAVGMVKNMASLIDRCGHIPNGNRTYYLSRSQPPMFASMVELVASRHGTDTYLSFLPQLQKEYDYWMRGGSRTAPGEACEHVVQLADGTQLNRYWDDLDVPRDESYREDLETAEQAARSPEQIFRDKRAACESGWDFSSRWLADPLDLSTIRTTSILPVDLNSMMVKLERVLARAYRLQGDEANAARYEDAARAREHAIRTLMWDAEAGAFLDYLWTDGVRTDVISAATAYPLYFAIATEDQARAVAATIRGKLLSSGGMATTLNESGQQWDKPFGWAPLQYLAVQGLRAYSEYELAEDIARRWMDKVGSTYDAHGLLLEKYNVETDAADPAPHRGEGPGEYEMQTGFGWTNAVAIALMRLYPAGTQLDPNAPAKPLDACGDLVGVA